MRPARVDRFDPREVRARPLPSVGATPLFNAPAASPPGKSPAMHSVRRGLGVVAVGSLALTGLGTVTAVASSSATSYVVADGSSWVAQAYESTDGGADLAPRQSDVTGPQRAPFGAGSHQIVIGDSTVQTELYRTPAYDGQALSSLTRLEYSTFAKRTTGDGALRQPTYLAPEPRHQRRRDPRPQPLLLPGQQRRPHRSPTGCGRPGTWPADGCTSTATTAPASRRALPTSRPATRTPPW